MRKLAEELAAKQRELDQMRREAEDREDTLKSQVSELRYEAQKAALDVRNQLCFDGHCARALGVCCWLTRRARQAEAEAAKASMLALTNSDLQKVQPQPLNLCRTRPHSPRTHAHAHVAA
jgi:hypothetical protein